MLILFVATTPNYWTDFNKNIAKRFVGTFRRLAIYKVRLSLKIILKFKPDVFLFLLAIFLHAII